MSIPASSGAVPAHLLWRLLAAFYDLLPVLAIWFAVAALLLLANGNTPIVPGGVGAWIERTALLLSAFAYFGLSWRRGGQTLGMRAWRLRLLRSDGGVPSWPALALRYAVAIVSLAAFGLGFAWSLIDRQRRSWHDLASGTMVLRLARKKRPEEA